MIVLMCTLFLVFQVAPVYGYHGSLAPPVNPVVSFRRLRYVVHWEAGPGSPTGVHYSVETYALSVGRWASVPGCESVFSLECDVTESFSSIDDTYFTRVAAHLGHLASQPTPCPSGFKPRNDTKAGPPLMSLSPCNQSLCINLKPPADWLTELYKSYKYKLNISTQGGSKHLALVDTDLREYVLKDVVPGQDYCVSVGITHTHTESTPQCVTAPTPFNTEALLSVLVCVFVVVVVASVPFMVYSGYFCLRTTLPSILVNFLSPHLPLLLRAVDPVLSLVSVVTTQAKGRLEEEESEEEEGSEGRVGYERRVQAGSSSSSSPADTPPLPPETEDYKCGRGLELAPPLVESGSAGERRGDMEDGGVEEEEDRGGENVCILSVTLGEKDGVIEEDEEEKGENVNLFSVTLREKEREEEEEEEGEDEEEEEGEDVNLFSVMLGMTKTKEERKRREEECELTDVWAPLLTTAPLSHTHTHTHTPVHETTHSSPEQEEEEEEEEEATGYMRRS
ncbi:cytokine receptor family member b2 isoform X2 [Alosa sapidissima]|uniref:cytokine receptor family member b2 isoform X2 n=1 Tax=Alosa sapidissima TaxID=34773 RepID=UPI001C08E33F|nr:cytokine receptor family member b2 isoform X2 [Alosa sapidissima]